MDPLPLSQRPDTTAFPPPSDLDLTLGAPIPGEDEAWTSYQSLQKSRAENAPMDPVAVSTWTNYRDTAKKYNRPLFPSKTQQHRQTIADYSDKLLGGLDTLTTALPPEQAQQVNARLQAFPEPERAAELARTANYALLSTANGQKIKPDAYDSYRTLYAKQVLKLDDTSDLAVYNELKRRNDEKKDADANIAADFEILGAQALAGKPVDIEAHAKKYAEYFTPAIAEAATLELRNRVKQARTLGKTVQPIAEALKSYILIEANRADAVDPNDPNRDKAALPPITLGEASARFAKLTEEQKAAVTIYLGQNLQNLPEDPDGTLKRTFEKFGQSAVDSGRAALNFINRATMPGDETSAKNFSDWLTSSAFLKGKAAKIGNLTKPTDGWSTHIALATAEQLPYMLAASSGIGTVATGLSMAGQSYEQARHGNPEGNDTAQFLAGAASGAAQAVIERAALNVVGRSLGALPILKNSFGAKFGTESFLKLARITDPLTRAAVGTAAGALTVGATEYTEEVAQDLVDRTLQDLASLPTGITDDYGKTSSIYQNLKTVASSWSPTSEKGAKLMLSLIPFLIIGGGGGGFASFNNGLALKQNAAAMRLIGVPEPIVAEIVNTPDVTRAETLLQQALTTEAQVIDQKKANEYAEALIAHTEAIQSAWDAQGAQILEPQFDEAGTVVGVSLSLPTGTQYYDTEQAAQEALVKWSMETQEQMIDGGVEAYTLDTVDFLTEPGQRAAATDFSINQRDITGTFENFIKEGLATNELLKTRLAVFAMKEGLSATQAAAQIGSLRIRARNFSENIGKRGTRYVVELFKGADPMNAREDFAEAYWKAAVQEELFTPETAIGWIRDMEKSTGQPYLDQSFQWTPGTDNLLFWEALGQASNEYALHHYKHPSVSPKFKQWVEMMLTALGTAWNWFKTMARGANLQGAIDRGALKPQFVRLLSDSVGLNEQSREARVMQREQENSMAEYLDQFPKLSQQIKGKLLHPARAAAQNHPELRELRRIYDGLTTSKRKINKHGRATYIDYKLTAENFFAPSTENVKLDDLLTTLNEQGFNFESTSEMLQATEDALFYGRESYATQSPDLTTNNQSFSLTPNQSTTSIPSTQSDQTPLITDNSTLPTFSLSRDTQHNLQTIIEARMSRGPEERIAIMVTMRDRLQSLAFKLESREAGDLTPMEKQLQGWRGKDLTEAQKERLRIEDALATVKGILSALPTEIRAKVQVPFSRILDADTDKTTVNAFRELIANADEVIEKDLQDTYVERITDLLDRARATSDEKRTNKTLLTPETQRIIDQIDAIVEMDAMELFGAETRAEADLHTLQAQIDQSDDEQLRRDLTQKQIQLLEYQRDLHTFGAIGDQSAAELSKTYAALKDVYIRGRATRKILDDESRYNLHANRTELKHVLGFPDGVSGPAHDRATNATAGKSLKNFLKGLTLDHFSFHQVLELLFPNSITAQEWSNKALAAMRGTKRRRLAANQRFEEFMAARFGARTQRARAEIIASLSERKNRKASVAEALKTKTEKIPIDRVPALLSGENKVSWSDNPHAIAQLSAAWREFRLLSEKKQKRREFLTVQIITARRPAEGLLMSDLELLDVLQTYAQESYAASMDKYGYTPAVIEQIKQEIDPRALAIGEFLRAEYDAGWKEMNPVYQRMFHMDMPQHRNYAPGTFANMSISNQEVNGSPLGQAGNANAMSAGATKNRRSHVSRPLTKSALSKYLAHIEQTTYWIEWAELVKEISATVRPPEVRRSIEARHGKQSAAVVDQWINYLNTDGADNARGILLAHETIIDSMMSAQSNLGLAWNLSVPFKQFSAMLGSMTMENPREALKSWARITTQWPTLKTIFQSEAIQQRLQDGFSPESKALLDSTKLNPSRLMSILHAGHMPAALTDAAMTTISAFISYDIAYRRAIAQKNNPEQAHLAAMQRMDRVVAMTAQPNETQLKSLIELRNSRGMGRLLTMFRSDPRARVASITASAWKLKRGDTSIEQFTTVLLTQWLLYGALGALGKAIFKSITQDEDDDTDYWSAKNFILGSLLGPIEGITLLGSTMAYSIRSLAGEKPFQSSANPLEAQISKLTQLDFDKFATDPFDQANILAQAFAMASSVAGAPQATLLPAAIRIADQVAQAIDKHTETTDEKLARLVTEFTTNATSQTQATTNAIDAAVEQALALPPEQQAQALANLDEPSKAKAREKINKAKAQANMSDLELKLSKMSKSRRTEAITYILQNLPEPEQQPFQNRMQILFPEKP